MQTADYARISKAILYLEIKFRNPSEPGNLRAALRTAGMSDIQCRRFVRRWAGVSPERFAEYLSAAYAIEILKESRKVLDPARAACPSMPEYSSDSPVQVLSFASCGENSGTGIIIQYGVHAGPYGHFFLALEERNVCRLSFLRGKGVGGEVSALRRTWPGATVVRDQGGTKSAAVRIFGRPGELPAPPMGAIVKGTAFQVKVWKAIARIPPGLFVSYEDVAAWVGAPRAVRAVGTALARNPVPYLIPCHRVIRKTGELGNYGGGTDRKKAMLAREAAQREAGLFHGACRSRRCDTIPTGFSGKTE